MSPSPRRRWLLAAAALAFGCAAPRTAPPPPPAAPSDAPSFTFRGRPFGVPPSPWMKELPLPASLMDRGFAWYDDPADAEAIGDIGMDGITYAYRDDRLFEIQVVKAGLTTEAEALALADRLAEALSVKHRVTAAEWKRRTDRRAQSDRQGKASQEVWEDVRSLAAEGAELRVAATGRSKGGQGDYAVAVRFVEAAAARELDRILGGRP